MANLKTVAINDLIVWTDNPRMANEQIFAETDAMNILIEEVGIKKMKALAQDIFSHGLNPHRQPIVVSNNNGTYNVYDGNRRITVIKCVLQGDERFKKIENEIGLKLETEILVCVADAEEAFRLIEIEHAGEGDGQGQINWEAFQRDYAFNQNRKPVVYPYAFKISRICNLTRKSDFKKIPYTDLESIFQNEIIKQLFGIKNEWDFNNVNLIKEVYQRLCDAKTRTPYSRYLPRLKNEEELSKFKLKIFSEKQESLHSTPEKSKEDDSNPSSNTLVLAHDLPTTTHNSERNIILSKRPTSGKTLAQEALSDRRKYNNYKVNPIVLFQWRGKGINIDHPVFKPTLAYAIGLQINTEMESRRIAPYLYRVLLEIALRHWCVWYQSNESLFNINNIPNYKMIKDNILGTTSAADVSFASEKKIKNVILVLKNIKNRTSNFDIRAYFKNRSSESFADMIKEFNEVIHGVKEYIDASALEKYDEMVLNYLIALSISLNGTS